MAMDKKQIKLFITAETKKAVKALNKVEKEQKNIKKQNDGLKKSFVGLGKAIVGAFAIRAIASFAKEALILKGQTEQLTKAFKNLGSSVGFNSKSLDKFRKATNGTVSDIDLMTQANNAMLLGIVQSDDQFADLIDSAQRLAQAVGKDAIFGIESLTTGIGRQSKLMLDNLGIIVDTNRAYEIYAESIGKSTSALDDNERKQAFIQATMESVNQKVSQLGEETLSSTETIAQLDVAMENLKTATGSFVEGPGVGFVNFLTDVVSGAEISIEKIGGLITEVKNFPDKFQEGLDSIGEKAGPQIATFDEFVGPLTQQGMNEKKKELHLQYLQSINGMEEEALQARIDLGFGFLEQENNLETSRLTKRLTNLKAYFDAQKILENEAHQLRIKNNLESAILSGQSSKEAAQSVIKAEVAEAQAGLISSIMKALPFPFNLAVAAGAGSMIGKVTDQLLSFETGGSFVTKGRTTLPIGNGVVVGDNASGMERIDVTPLPSPNQRSSGNIVVNINAPVVDEFVVDSIIPAIRRAEKLNL